MLHKSSWFHFVSVFRPIRGVVVFVDRQEETEEESGLFTFIKLKLLQCHTSVSEIIFCHTSAHFCNNVHTLLCNSLLKQQQSVYFYLDLNNVFVKIRQ